MGIGDAPTESSAQPSDSLVVDPMERPASPEVSTLGHAVMRHRLRAALLGEDETEPVRIDRFVLLRELGQGGMGTVWLARDDQLDRQVALKFLRRSARGETAERRLFLEAQSLAKLSHPNVVPIYDVGRHEGRVWVAMEHVPGRTLRRWVEHEQPSPRRRLQAWIDAGRGLAAVHAAGLVHRDVKPDNVMMGDDGRVRLLDFGLVRAIGSEKGEPGGPSTETVSRGSTIDGEPEGSGRQPLTRTHQFVGTPAYAAPEQRRHGPIDVRTDQYSFCVSVWEALTGIRPRPDASRGAGSPTLEGRLPRRVRGVLTRGLALEPAERFDDMQALLDALAPRRRAWVLPLGSATIAGALGLSAALGSNEPDPCASAGTRIDELWSEAQRHELAARFPEPVARHATRVLDEWSSTWSDTARRSCEEVHAEGLRSAESLDRRGACLEQAHEQLEDLLEALARGQLGRAPELTRWLGELEDPARCSSPAVLDARTPRPQPEHEAELASLRRRLRLAELGLDPVALAERIDAAAEVHARAEQLGWAPLTGRAALVLGTLNLNDGRSAPARSWYGRALDHGQDLRDLELLARAQHGLGQVELLLELDPDAARWRVDREAALVRQLDDPPAALAARLADEAYLQRLRGDLPAAQESLRASVEAWERAGPRHVWGLATGLRQLADALDEGGRTDEATAILERARALELLDELSGATRVEEHESAYNEGVTALGAGELETAEAALSRALDAAIERQGPRGRVVALVHVAQAGLADAIGDLDAAREHARAADTIASKTLAPDHPERIPALTALGLAEFRAGRMEAAASVYRRALTIAEARLPPGSIDLAAQHLNLGETLHELGRDGTARDHLVRALEVFERTLPPDHLYLAVTLKALGRVELRRGDAERARALLHRAAATFETAPSSRVEHAEVLWSLARAEADLGSLPTARTRATEAAAAFGALGEDWVDRAAEIRRWSAELEDGAIPP